EFGELGLVIGIVHGARAQAVADGEGYVVGAHDLADFTPVGVEEVFLVMGQAPFGHDAAAAGNDACHPFGGHGYVTQQDAGMYGEIIHSLLGLLDQGIAVDFPGQILGLAVHLIQVLVNGHGADGNGRIAEDALAGLVDVLAGGKIHDGIGAPAHGPYHLFDFLFDGRGDGGVADVGVDLDQEVTPDDHGLEFGMVDIARDDGPPARHLVPDEFGGDDFRNGGPAGIARVLEHQGLFAQRGLQVLSRSAWP